MVSRRQFNLHLAVAASRFPPGLARAAAPPPPGLAPAGELRERIRLTADRLTVAGLPRYTQDFILADVTLDRQRRFTEFSGVATWLRYRSAGQGAAETALARTRPRGGHRRAESPSARARFLRDWRHDLGRRTKLSTSLLAQQQPWKQPWWKAPREEALTMVYILGIHPLALFGLLLYPAPGWPVVLSALAVTALGGLGTTVGYHRALAHRAVTLHPAVEQLLIFFAVFNGSGSPQSWIANHRNHHAHSDTLEDVSSPSHGGFWWAHLRWLYQWPTSPMQRWCPDLVRPRYLVWGRLQPFLVATSLTFGYALFGWPGFFWLGAIRLVYSLHGQGVVNSLLHMKPDASGTPDTSQNLWWLGPLQLTAWGENWHENHHRTPWCAKFSRRWWQVDVGWYAICTLEAAGLATRVRREPPSP